jgi:hypothetical protein
LNKEENKEEGYNPLFGRKVNNYNENVLKKDIGLYENNSGRGSNRPLSSKPVERSKTPIIGNTPVIKKDPILPEYEQYKPKIGISPSYKDINTNVNTPISKPTRASSARPTGHNGHTPTNLNKPTYGINKPYNANTPNKAVNNIINKPRELTPIKDYTPKPYIEIKRQPIAEPRSKSPGINLPIKGYDYKSNPLKPNNIIATRPNSSKISVKKPLETADKILLNPIKIGGGKIPNNYLRPNSRPTGEQNLVRVLSNNDQKIINIYNRK